MHIKHVLNHGYVRLVDHMGDDHSIIKAARVSYNAEKRSGKDDKSDFKLLKYLLKNKHTSPFEHVQFTFEVHAPLFVFRQWHRHRTWSYNEVSARYTELPEFMYVPEKENIGIQSEHNKQQRILDFPGTKLPNRNYEISKLIREQNDAAFRVYKSLLTMECPRELARSVLPLNIYSKMFATVDLHNLLHFFTLRDHEHSQYEIQVYAQAMKELITPIVPNTIEIFSELQND